LNHARAKASASSSVRMLVHRSQHRNPGTRYTQSSPPQQVLDFQPRGHRPSMEPFSGISQEHRRQPSTCSFPRSARNREDGGVEGSSTDTGVQVVDVRNQQAFPRTGWRGGWAQDNRCAAVGEMAMFSPTSAMIAWAA
jgi:hypothetical protein